MIELIDLSQEIFSCMPIHKTQPAVRVSIHATHEQWEGLSDTGTLSPAVNKLEMGEHTVTHVDALNHMARENFGQSIDTMPLSMFYTEGICLDFSHKSSRELIGASEIKEVCKKDGLEIKPNDTVLFYTDHYRKFYGGKDWANGPGLSADAVRFLGEQKISAFGVETMAPGVSGVSNKDVHRICGEMGFTHYENLVNLHLLIGRGRFRFIGFPLKIRGGTGSPVRAVAVFGETDL